MFIDAAVEVHKVLGGPGLLERVYEEAQVLTYFRLSKYQVGLGLNFGQPLLRDGISGIVNDF